MESTSRPPLHPLLWIAAVAVILFAGVGTAHFLGLLPGKTEPQPATEAVPATAPSTATPPAPAAPVAASAAPAPAQKVVRKPSASPKPASQSGAPATAVSAPPAGPAYCSNCGAIDSVRQVTKEGEGSGLGAIAGGVIGGALGHNVGRGRGQDIATVAGAVGGAVLGNKIEKSQKSSSRWETTVRFEDGTSSIIGSDSQPSWRAGDRVKVVNGAIVPR